MNITFLMKLILYNNLLSSTSVRRHPNVPRNILQVHKLTPYTPVKCRTTIAEAKISTETTFHVQKTTLPLHGREIAVQSSTRSMKIVVVLQVVQEKHRNTTRCKVESDGFFTNYHQFTTNRTTFETMKSCLRTVSLNN
jgi:hypothetical protein